MAVGWRAVKFREVVILLQSIRKERKNKTYYILYAVLHSNITVSINNKKVITPIQKFIEGCAHVNLHLPFTLTLYKSPLTSTNPLLTKTRNLRSNVWPCKISVADFASLKLMVEFGSEFMNDRKSISFSEESNISINIPDSDCVIFLYG